MPLPLPTAARERMHSRTIRIEGFRREDGMFDMEGVLTDVKDHDIRLSSGPRAAGSPIHQMAVRLTIDDRLTIVDVAVAIDEMPYVGYCSRITPDYGRLKGVRIVSGFRNRLAELFGGTAGCTHITELIGAMATGAYQTLAGVRRQDPDRQPFQLDGCHALATTGEAVALYYPRWYRGPASTQGES